MAKVKRSLKELLTDISEAITQIKKYVAGLDWGAFKGSRLVQDAVIRQFTIIGEAASVIKKGAPQLKETHPALIENLKEAAGMRHHLVHEYERVDLEIVWRTIERFIPAFEQQLLDLLAALPPDAL